MLKAFSPPRADGECLIEVRLRTPNKGENVYIYALSRTRISTAEVEAKSGQRPGDAYLSIKAAYESK